MGRQNGDGLGMWRGDLARHGFGRCQVGVTLIGRFGLVVLEARAAAQAHKTQVDEVGGFSAQVLHHIGNCKLDSRSIRQRMVVFYG